MKRLLLAIAIVLTVFGLATPASAAEAYTQTHDVCKAQCVTWYYYWGNDGTLEYVMDKCSMGGWDSLKTLAKLGKDLYKGGTGTALGIVQDAIICAWTIDVAIAPVFDACDETCTADVHSYGPDIAITGLRYDEASEEIVIEVVNGGNSYTNEIEVDVYVASTSDRDCSVSYGEMFSYYTIPELAPGGARLYVEGLSSTHTKRIPWEAPEGKCSKIKVIVDPEEELPERYFETWGEGNNVREEWVNDLPVLPWYTIENMEYMQNGDSDDFRVGVTIKNNGEEMGWPSLSIKTCDGRGLAYVETVSVEPGETAYEGLPLDDLFNGEYATEKLQCIRAIVEDENGKTERTILIPLYSGTVSGTVYDMYGEVVKDATVTIDTGQSDTTDSKGKYKIVGVTRMGARTLTAHSPSHEFDGHANVTFSINTSEFASQDALYVTGVDLVLMDYPGSVTVYCPVADFDYRMDSGVFNYRGSSNGAWAEMGGVVPGNYTLMISKPGYTTEFHRIVVSSRDETTVQCQISQMSQYSDDSGVIFAPQQHDLWVQSPGEGYHMWFARISGDGSTVAVMASNSAQPNPMKLLVFSKEGQKLADFVFPYERFDSERGPLNPEMSLSYDGSKILIGNRYIYSKTGTLLSENPEGSVHQKAYISQDGAFVCHLNKLYSSGFTKLTQGLVSGSGEGDVRCPTSGIGGDSTYFSLGGSVLGDCREAEGACRVRFGAETQVDALDEKSVRCVAESDSGAVTVVSNQESGANKGSNIYYILNGARAWKKLMPTIDSYSGFGDILFSRISVTPAGGYIAALSGPKGKTYDLFVYDAQGNDVLQVSPYDSAEWGQFFDARATGTGIYYVKYGRNGEVTFGVLGQSGTAQKQQQDSGDWGPQESQMGVSDGTIPAIVAVSVTAFVLGFFAWKTGMLR